MREWRLAATFLLRATDDKTGKLLLGAAVDIGTRKHDTAHPHHRSCGTATGQLPVLSRKTRLRAMEIKAPAVPPPPDSSRFRG